MLTQEKTIGEMVAEDFRIAAIFKKHKIDFCCNGNRSMEEACERKHLQAEEIYNEIANLPSKNPNETDFNSCPLDLLADYVEKTHHRYVEEKSTILLQFLDKLCKVHGDRHPELFTITKLFQESAQELAAHMKKEELILFPFIKKMVAAKVNGEAIETSRFGSVENPIAMMMHDHNIEGERFREIARLTNDYHYPEDACGTYQVTYKMLEDFENDLHRHIHLENNILFPKAVLLEKTF